MSDGITATACDNVFVDVDSRCRLIDLLKSVANAAGQTLRQMLECPTARFDEFEEASFLGGGKQRMGAHARHPRRRLVIRRGSVIV